MRVRRFQLSTSQKIILWFVAAFTLWRGLHDPFVIEAILMFGLAGDIPGTSLSLSPEQVMGLSAGLITAIFMGIGIRKAVKSKKVRKSTPTTGIEPSVIRQPLVRPQLIRPHMYQHAVSERHTVQGVPENLMPITVEVRYRTWLGRLLHETAKKIQRIVPYIVWLGSYSAWLLKIAIRFVGQSIATGIKRSIAIATQIWRWVSPYLWRFDTWLGTQFHKTLKKTQYKMQAHDTMGILLDAAKHGKQTIQEMSTRLKR